VIRQLASRLERPYIAFDDILEAVPKARSKASDCAAAAAVALLAARYFKM
jgi:(4-(4-[2-(gamma-L-glutamylamino)ethyl]phenoxymethyl)furan-2-yl)methanamine synthase